MKKIIDAKYNAIPFTIEEGKYKVTVTSPLRARFMYLPLVEDHFEKSDTSILKLVFGVHEKGFQYSECMLKENDFVSGVISVVKV